MKTLKNALLLGYLLLLATACSQNDDVTGIDQLTVEDATAVDLAQTSGQLVSGSSFTISGNSIQAGTVNSRVVATSETAHAGNGNSNGKGKGIGKGSGKGGHKGVIDGLNLLAPNDEILAIIDAESSGEIRGFRISKFGGATLTHYDADGDVVQLPLPSSQEGPHEGPSGNQFPEIDSLLALIVKTEVDFGTGVTITRGEEEITRSGKIIIERSKVDNTLTEVITFEDYVVNEIQIFGVKTTVSTFDKTTGVGSLTSSVAGGKFIFADGTEASWTSEKSRDSEVVPSEDRRRPKEGTIIHQAKTSLITSSGDVIYSHETTTPVVIDLSCNGRRRGPIEGVVETLYRENEVIVDYGAGTCDNQTITITINGETTTKTIGGN